MKVIEKEYENQFNDYRKENVDGKEKFINEKLSKPPIYQLIKQIKLDGLLWEYDANGLYPSATWYESSIYPRIETRYAFTKDMNNDLVEIFNNGNFSQGGAILKIR